MTHSEGKILCQERNIRLQSDVAVVLSKYTSSRNNEIKKDTDSLPIVHILDSKLKLKPESVKHKA